MFVTLSHHYGLSCCAICTDDCRSAADNSCSQRSLDGVGELGKLRMLLPDVLNHLSLRYKDKVSVTVSYCKHRATVDLLWK